MRIAVAGGTGLVGRHVVEAARQAGHDPVVLARSVGVDTRSGAGLAAALEGVDAVVDATNASTPDGAQAEAFFVESTANLARIGAEAGVGHLVVLSIVGIDRAPTAYYRAKLAHERAALDGAVPASIVRATQFHEFPAQLIARGRRGGTAELPSLRVRTVAARTVGRMLAEIAEGAPLRDRLEVGGPEEADLVPLARRFVGHFHLAIEVTPGEATVPPGALLPGVGARIEGPTFDDWLAGDDAAGMARAIAPAGGTDARVASGPGASSGV